MDIKFLKELLEKIEEAQVCGEDFCLTCMREAKCECWGKNHWILIYDLNDGIDDLSGAIKLLRWLIKKLEEGE
ncbi:MAG: hypothetical protein J7J51_05230 [Candidatus Omnitrophica bacterium]|nr:hypothetical protein [Candidatus Omnitrophota bacterium]